MCAFPYAWQRNVSILCCVSIFLYKILYVQPSGVIHMSHIDELHER